MVTIAECKAEKPVTLEPLGYENYLREAQAFPANLANWRQKDEARRADLQQQRAALDAKVTEAKDATSARAAEVD